MFRFEPLRIKSEFIEHLGSAYAERGCAAWPTIMRTVSTRFMSMPRVSGAVRIMASDSRFHATQRATTPQGDPAARLTSHTARTGIGPPAIRFAPVYASADP